MGVAGGKGTACDMDSLIKALKDTKLFAMADQIAQDNLHKFAIVDVVQVVVVSVYVMCTIF